MSYILDALKKAEAQRKLGAVPSIHAQAPGNLPVAGARVNISRLWMVPLAVLLIGGALVWYAPWQAALAPPVKVLSQAPPVPQIVPQTVATQAAAPVATAPAEARPIGENPAPLASVVATAPNAKAESQPSKPIKESKVDKLPSAPVSAPAASPSKELPMLHELPENIQREIPALTIGGYLYAANPSARDLATAVRTTMTKLGPGLAAPMAMAAAIARMARVASIPPIYKDRRRRAIRRP